MKKMIRLAVLAVCLWASISHAQPTPPGPPGNPGTNGGSGPTGAIFAPANTNIIATSSNEVLLLDTFPVTPDPTQVLPSWVTTHNRMMIDPLAEPITDTNNVPYDSPGMPAGNVVGVVINGSGSNVFTVTRGEFLVLLTNDSGQLDNTILKLSISRNTNAFSLLFEQRMMTADFLTNDPALTLTPVAGVSNLYDLMVTFPPCIVAAPRVVSLRTEPVNYNCPFTQMQILAGTGDTNAVPTYTTDQTGTNFMQASVVPAMRLWTEAVTGIGSYQFMSLTPNLLNVLGVPGTVLQTATNASDAFQDFPLSDSTQGSTQFDVTQNSSLFFARRVDTNSY